MGPPLVTRQMSNLRPIVFGNENTPKSQPTITRLTSALQSVPGEVDLIAGGDNSTTTCPQVVD